jgi:hypothetical protein
MLDLILFRTGVIGLFMVSLIDKPKRQIPQDILQIVLSLFTIAIINIFIHTFAPVTMMGFQNLCLGIIGFCIVYIYWDEKQDIRRYILYAGLINLLFFIGQRFGFNPAFNKMPFTGEEGGLLGNKQRLMTYFTLLTPFLPMPFLIISFVLGIFTKQYIIFIPIALMLFAKRKMPFGRLIIALSTLIALYILRGRLFASLAYRFNNAWSPALTAFFKQCLIGFGLGARVLPDMEVIGSSYLQFIFSVGIIGAAWIGYVFKTIYKKISFNRESVAFMTLTLVMTVEYPLEILRLWFLVIAILTMFLIKQKGAPQCL